jgi:hypothetical protein
MALCLHTYECNKRINIARTDKSEPECCQPKGLKLRTTIHDQVYQCYINVTVPQYCYRPVYMCVCLCLQRDFYVASLSVNRLTIEIYDRYECENGPKRICYLTKHRFATITLIRLPPPKKSVNVDHLHCNSASGK